MSKNLTIIVDEDVYEKFNMALSLTKENYNQALENCMKIYIAKSFEKVSQIYNPKALAKMSVKTSEYYTGKAVNRIPLWAFKPEQYNHKIIRAYFQAEKLAGTVKISDMERLCSDRTHPELYVPTFKSNYAQMKLDGPKSHGKIFEDDGDTVTIWNEIRDTLMKYKVYFS